MKKSVNYSEHISDKNLYILMGDDEAWDATKGLNDSDGSDDDGGEGVSTKDLNAARKVLSKSDSKKNAVMKKKNDKSICKYCNRAYVNISRHTAACKQRVKIEARRAKELKREEDLEKSQAIELRPYMYCPKAFTRHARMGPLSFFCQSRWASSARRCQNIRSQPRRRRR